jgi:hypothetical protein
MKRYIIFYGDTYYASGGVLDLLPDSYDTPNEAIAAAEQKYKKDGSEYNWYQVVDKNNMKAIERGGNCYGGGNNQQ